MRRLSLLLFGILLGGGLVFLAFHYHLVRTAQGVVIVPKVETSLADPYADIRDWTPQDWSDHPELIHSLMADGRGNLVQKSVSQGLFRDLFRNPNRHSSQRNRL